MYVCMYVFFFYSLSWSGRRLEVGDGMILVVYLGCLVYVYSEKEEGGLEDRRKDLLGGLGFF